MAAANQGVRAAEVETRTARGAWPFNSTICFSGGAAGIEAGSTELSIKSLSGA